MIRTVSALESEIKVRYLPLALLTYIRLVVLEPGEGPSGGPLGGHAVTCSPWSPCGVDLTRGIYFAGTLEPAPSLFFGGGGGLFLPVFSDKEASFLPTQNSLRVRLP